MCVVLEGLLTDYMAKENYIGLAIELLGDYKRLWKNKRLYIYVQLGQLGNYRRLGNHRRLSQLGNYRRLG